MLLLEEPRLSWADLVMVAATASNACNLRNVFCVVRFQQIQQNFVRKFCCPRSPLCILDKSRLYCLCWGVGNRNSGELTMIAVMSPRSRHRVVFVVSCCASRMKRRGEGSEERRKEGI